MSRVSVVLLSLLVAACQSTRVTPSAADHCLFDIESEWSETIPDLQLSESLLGIEVGGKAVEDWILLSGDNVRDVWFTNGRGDLQFCRYEDIEDSCISEAWTVEFSLIQGEYVVTDGSEKVCIGNNFGT